MPASVFPQPVGPVSVNTPRAEERPLSRQSRCPLRSHPRALLRGLRARRRRLPQRQLTPEPAQVVYRWRRSRCPRPCLSRRHQRSRCPLPQSFCSRRRHQPPVPSAGQRTPCCPSLRQAEFRNRGLPSRLTDLRQPACFPSRDQLRLPCRRRPVSPWPRMAESDSGVAVHAQSPIRCKPGALRPKRHDRKPAKSASWQRADACQTGRSPAAPVHVHTAEPS